MDIRNLLHVDCNGCIAGASHHTVWTLALLVSIDTIGSTHLDLPTFAPKTPGRGFAVIEARGHARAEALYLVWRCNAISCTRRCFGRFGFGRDAQFELARNQRWSVAEFRRRLKAYRSFSPTITISGSGS